MWEKQDRGGERERRETGEGRREKRGGEWKGRREGGRGETGGKGGRGRGGDDVIHVHIRMQGYSIHTYKVVLCPGAMNSGRCIIGVLKNEGGEVLGSS